MTCATCGNDCSKLVIIVDPSAAPKGLVIYSGNEPHVRDITNTSVNALYRDGICEMACYLHRKHLKTQ